MASTTKLRLTTQREGSRSNTQSGGDGDPLAGLRTVGRYVLREELGRGGMGAVYLAHDPQLDREVAIKLLHHRGGSQQRLLREAQSVARIRHSNIVAVHDVGEFEAEGHVGVFMVMEFLRGQTLRQWVAAGTRSPEDLLGVFSQAAHGLQAAHERGLVHRDFKPSNVLVDDDGHAFVLDFGLARAAAGDLGSTEQVPAASPSTSLPASASEPLTEVGMVVGTPLYMSPEQHAGKPLDAASDQYSFCLALYEALAGSLPFADRDASAMARAKREDTLETNTLPISRARRRALARGLRVNPRKRWPSMAALDQALKRGGTSWRRSAALAGAAFGAVGIGVSLQGGGEPSRPADCDHTDDRIAAVFDDADRQAIAAAFSTEHAAVHDYVVAQVGDAVENLGQAHLDACTQRQHAEVPLPQLEARARCIGRRVTDLTKVVDRFAAGDPASIRRAPEIMGLVIDPRPCEGPNNLDADSSTSDDLRERLFDLRILVAEFALDAAVAEYDTLLQVARDRGDESFVVAVLLTGAWLHVRTRQLDALLLATSDALNLSEKLGRDDWAVQALIGRAMALKDGPAESIPEARHALDLAQAKAERLGDDAADLRARLAYVDASLCQREVFEDRPGVTAKQCLTLSQAAVAAAEDRSPVELGNALNLAANAAVGVGDSEAGRAMIDRAIAIRSSVVGVADPSLIVSYRVRARIAVSVGDVDAALADFDRCVMMLGDQPNGATAGAGLLIERGDLYVSSGRFALAEADYRRASEHAPAQFRLPLLEKIAAAVFMSGDVARAGPEVDAALQAEANTQPRDPAVRAETLTLKAEIEIALGRTEEGIRIATQAREIFDTSGILRPNPRVLNLVVLGRGLRLARRAAEARTVFAEAREVFDRGGPNAEPRFAGRILVEQGLLEDDPARLAEGLTMLEGDATLTRLRDEGQARLDALQTR